MAIFRLGSWGLPEFGITEAIQRTFAPQKAMASSGGSNLIVAQPKPQAQAPAQQFGPNYEGVAQLNALRQASSQPAPIVSNGSGNVGGGQPSGQPSQQQLHHCLP